MKRAAIGLRVHSGWAALVTVSVADGLPLVLSRQRIQLVKTFSYTFRQPYHTAARMDRVDAGKFVDNVRSEAEGIAREGLAAEQAELKALGYRLDHGCLLLASGRKLPELEKILLSHALIHTADGELFRGALRAASSRCMLRLTCIRERDLLQTCAGSFSRTPLQLLSEVTKLGKGMGAPWSQDEKFATLAAWWVLSGQRRATAK
jgi:hypothetical protein